MQKKVLVVEDDFYNLETYKNALKALDLNSVTAQNGLEGLDSYCDYRDELAAIITDLDMPKMNGFEMIRVLKKVYKSDLPIFMISGSKVNDKDKSIYDRYGVKDFLEKPVDLSSLIQKLKRLIDLNQ